MEWKTTFYSDFTIADKFGPFAIKDTYKRAFNEWKTNTEYVTELAIVLNLKAFEHYYKYDALVDPQAKNYEDFITGIYDKLWVETDNWCCENLKGDDLDYYFKTTD